MLRVQDSLLTVIDIQGKLAGMCVEHTKTYANVIRLIKTARVFSLPIVWTQQAPDKIGHTLPEVVAELDGIQPINKLSFSCYGEAQFVSALKEHRRPQIILTGIETHVCVYQTAMDLLDQGYEVYLVADAVSARFIFDHATALDDMQHQGVRIVSTEMALTQLLQGAHNPKFKDVMAYFKRG